MTDLSFPATGTARVHVVHEGYLRESDDGEHVGGTVTLIIDGDAVIVVDPGMVSSRDALLSAIAGHGVAPGDVSDVVFSHHHPDHTVNAALFPVAKIHDHWATYDGDLWISREAEGARLSESVALIATPGHTGEDITTLAATPDGVHACTHAWWGSDGPAEDPFSNDLDALAASRARVLTLAAVIIPGHGPAFTPGPATPR
ncbi:MAG TPA: MBL fold metallo-hydrolase [Streptosporangiaceae bacterium]|jgi:glyoxylase-like metal-dependent hydrolase (beta-lactamase superfamily II)